MKTLILVLICAVSAAASGQTNNFARAQSVELPGVSQLYQITNRIAALELQRAKLVAEYKDTQSERDLKLQANKITPKQRNAIATTQGKAHKAKVDDVDRKIAELQLVEMQIRKTYKLGSMPPVKKHRD